MFPTDRAIDAEVFDRDKTHVIGGLSIRDNGHPQVFRDQRKLLFSCSTMHPAYSRLFFAMKNLTGDVQQQTHEVGAKVVSDLWKIVDK